MCKPVNFSSGTDVCNGNISQAQGLQRVVLHVSMHVHAEVDPLARMVV